MLVFCDIKFLNVLQVKWCEPVRSNYHYSDTLCQMFDLEIVITGIHILFLFI